MQHIINTTERTLISDIANSLEKHSMQCRCGSLAAPLHKQGHLYQCLSCDKIYDGISYNFTRLSPICSGEPPSIYSDIIQIDCFDEAIKLLKQKVEQQQMASPFYSRMFKQIFSKKRH